MQHLQGDASYFHYLNNLGFPINFRKVNKTKTSNFKKYVYIRSFALLLVSRRILPYINQYRESLMLILQNKNNKSANYCCVTQQVLSREEIFFS